MGNMYVFCWILVMACLICSCAQRSGAVEVATDDGLSLEFGSQGEIVSCRIEDVELLAGETFGGFFVADVQDVPAQEVSLIDNASFEQTNGGKPVGWDVGRNWRLDRQVAHTGDASMRVRLSDYSGTHSGSVSIELPVRPNTPYRLNWWLRTEGCAPAVYIVQYDAHGEMHRDYRQTTISHGRTNEEWFEMTHSFTTTFFCRKIQVYCNVWEQTGTAWLDDVSVICLEDDYMSPQRLAQGQVHLEPGRVEQRCELAHQSLQLRALYTAGPNSITVDGEIEDTSGRDRAITLSFRLPIEASGWTWYDDIQNEHVIQDDMRYGAARLLDARDPRQRRTIALYPFAAMGNSDVALALAVPMDRPRVFRLCYDPNLGYFVNFEFGLSQATAKFPGKATFQFSIYRIDPAWGLRSAAERYYDSHRQSFRKRADREGALGNMPDRQAIEQASVVMPAFADFNWEFRDSAEANRRELTKLLRYTEFIGWWGWALGITSAQAQRQPTEDEAWAHVEALASRNPPEEVAVSILNCALHDAEGMRRLHWEYAPQWGGYNYLCNPDPEIAGLGGKVNRFTLTYDREVSEVDTLGLDGMRFDNPVVFGTDNFRREHFQWVDHPLAFDHVSKRPVIPLDFSSFECAKAIAEDMHARGKFVASNYAPVGYPSDIFRIGLLDVVENETLWTWPTNAKLALQRTLAGPKIVCMSAQEDKKDWPADQIEREMKHAMFYGTFYYLSTALEASDRWLPLTRRLAGAGWEPVTHARCPALGPMVERFGDFSGRDLHFTLRNEGSELQRVEIEIDAEALNLHTMPEPTVWLMQDAQTYEPIQTDNAGRQWRIRAIVPTGDTVVLRVATVYGLALDRLFQVPDYLIKAANYRDALQGANRTPKCPDYESLLESIAIIRSDLTMQENEPARVRSDLQAMADTLSVSNIQLGTTETVWWGRRLAQCTEAAKQEILAAVDVLPEG